MSPAFAVVGHPNKGKSSIVATLARDDGVAISEQSGTTRVNESFRVSVGRASYMLIDTPGFQRPTAVLQWLERHADNAGQRQEAVNKFIADEQCQQLYPDEVQLLSPIMEGAAILYVVDGSRPYGSEYETEMEILRWTGQSSMALINPIENERHIDDWEKALSQYFKVVKVFNAMQADFEKQLAILETFSHLKDQWKSSLTPLISEFRSNRMQQKEKSADILATLLTDLCSFQVSRQVLDLAQAKALQSTLEQFYMKEMKRLENKAQLELKQLYQYQNLESSIYELPFDNDLFDTEKWIVWGLNRKQLTAAAAMAGAAAGAMIDAGLAGQSLMLGALGGGVIAGGSVWFGANKIADYKLKGLPVGGYEARQGPIKNRNFPYVVLGRFLFLEQVLRNRNHARRDDLEIKEGDLAELLEQLNNSQLKNLHQNFSRLIRQKKVEDLLAVLRPLFTQ